MACYKGKITSCHTQALFNAFFKKATYDDYLLFEAISTNPFGIKHISNDSNRILDAYLDFDLGLDRALSILDMQYRTAFFEHDSDVKQALSILKNWLYQDVVVVGPLNMQDIRYLYYPQLYNALDHYLVVLKYEDDNFYFLDSEGFSYISLEKEEFINAWKGDKIIEGRGKFIMRQIVRKNSILLNEAVQQKALHYIIDNFQLAEKAKYGGSYAYHYLSMLDIDRNLLTGLTYAVPIRLQRLFIQNNFFKKLNIETKVHLIIHEQVSILNSILSQIMESKNYSPDNFIKLSLLEKQLLDEVKYIERIS